MSKKLLDIQKKIVPIFRQYGVIKADVFGSRARGKAKRNSDLDLMVSLKKPIGLFKFGELNDKLENALHMKVDLLTYNSISPRLKPFIKKDLLRIYDSKKT